MTSRQVPAATTASPRRSPAAALSAALAGPEPASIAAADGLLLRGGRRHCDGPIAKLAAPDGLVRYHVIQAAERLGCIGREILGPIAERDDNEDIRNLADTLLKERRD